jgi:hypothetical protein
MGIDGIGKKGPITPQGPATGPQEATRAFEVPQAAPVAAPAPVNAPTALDRLRSGELDLNGYVDAKVQEATAHLGPLPPERLAEIRSMLVDRVASDPLLVDLVRTATGRVPPPPADD